MPDDPRTSEIGNTRAISIRRPECQSEDENTTPHFRSLAGLCLATRIHCLPFSSFLPRISLCKFLYYTLNVMVSMLFIFDG